MEKLDLEDESYFASPTDTGSTSSSDNIQLGRACEHRPRTSLNTFLEDCGLRPIERPWLEWDQASERTRERYVDRSAEIISSVLNVIYPGATISLWKELQKSPKMLDLLGPTAADLTENSNSYLEALAESYKHATSWDTRRQVLSVMTGVASFQEISKYIPGLTQYRYTSANLHRHQYGRAAPVPKTGASRLRVDRQQVDHFLCFITSPHLVQDLPFGEKKLTFSTGQTVTIPNVIGTMVPQRIVDQYKLYCEESSFTPVGERTLLRILNECSASVRKSLQGLDYFAADGGKAFDDLLDLLDKISFFQNDNKNVAKEREALKVGKLYLKGDYKVGDFN